MSETYEQFRDSATGEAGVAWKTIDKERTSLREYYQQLKDDPKYADDYKSEQAWARYATAKERIGANVPKAHEGFEKQIRSAERFSIPVPPGESLTTSDATEIVAAQNEASRIVRRIDRAAGSAGSARGAAKGPFQLDRRQILVAEYKRGLELGGTQGAIICRGVLSAADELGVDVDSVVDDFRRERHRESLERAQHLRRLRDLISKEVPQPPFPRPGARRGGDMHSGRNNFLVRNSAGDQMLKEQGGHSFAGQKKRRPAWK